MHSIASDSISLLTRITEMEKEFYAISEERMRAASSGDIKRAQELGLQLKGLFVELEGLQKRANKLKKNARKSQRTRFPWQR